MMQHTLSRTVAICAFTLIVPLFSQAHADEEKGKKNCENLLNTNGGHCAYVAGLSDQKEEGRYLKLYVPATNWSIVTCITGSNIYVINNEAPPLRQNKEQYSICTNLEGTQCEPLGVDSYYTMKKGDKYITDPAIYKIDFSALKDGYPACTSAWGFNSQGNTSFQLSSSR